MLYHKPQYHPLALDALRKLDAEGIVCTPDEILWLHKEAQATTRPCPGDGALLDFPFQVGDTLLWPLTLGADAWLNQYAAPLYSSSGGTAAPPSASLRQFANLKFQTLCIGYAMAHSRRPEMFHQLTTRRKILWRVTYWAAGLSCTLRELSAGVDRVLGVSDVDLVDIPTPKEKSQGKNQKSASPDYSAYGEVLAQLCHFYGGTPAQWQWGEPAARITELLRAAARIIPGADDDSARAAALARNKFNAVVNHIRAAHLKSEI